MTVVPSAIVKLVRLSEGAKLVSVSVCEGSDADAQQAEAPAADEPPQAAE